MVQMGGRLLSRIKAFLPGKKPEGDIKPDQSLLEMGAEIGLPLHQGCK